MSFSDLPNVSNSLDKYPCHDWCTCDELDLTSKEVKKDRRLENWEKWSAARKSLNENLSETLDRGPHRTVLNSADDLRTVKEEKTVLEYVNIPYPHDKYRGSPAFWKTPLALPDLCNAKQPSSYLKVMTKEERCEIPEMEYVKVPDYIKAEMGYHSCGTKEALKRWNSLEYRQQRVEALKDQIRHVEPYKPDLNQLYIEGALVKKDQWEETLADMKLRLSTDVERTDETRAEYFVQINDIKITTASANTNKIFITFDYDLDSNQVMTKHLKVNNGTPLALRYHFQRCEKHSMFKDIISVVNSNRVFFFNMNQEIIPPNSSVNIPIWFKTSKEGIYKESYKFCTQPGVWINDLIIVFEGTALSGSLEERCATIKKRLTEKAKERSAKKTIDEMLADIPRPNGEPILYTYDRAMIFEAVNQMYDPFIRRPKYLYNKSVVDELETFYAHVKLPLHPDEWNYSIEDLRSVTKQRECYDFEQKILLEIESIKKNESEIDEDVDDKKDSFICNLLKDEGTDTVVDGMKEKRPYCAELEDIIMKLEQPSVWINLDRNKYEWTYQILCVCIDKICEEMNELNDEFFVDRTFRYPKITDQNMNFFAERIAFEFLEDTTIPGQFRVFGNERRPPECLKDIPMEDAMKRYRVYYGIPNDQERCDKKKNDKKGNEKKKGKAKNLKRNESKQNENVKGTYTAKVEYKMNENFDPYRKIDLPLTPELDSISEESRDFKVSYLQPAFLQVYNDRTYIIFYKNLESAIMRIFNVLENQSSKQVKLNVFKRILESSGRLNKIPQFKAMNLKQVINESFDLQEELSSSSTTDIKTPQFWMNEAVEQKEEGSLWSLLRVPKQSEIFEKPISYPEEQVIFKRRYKMQHALNEVGTVMSNAGIDPLWEGFKNVDVQTCDKFIPIEKDSRESQENSEIQNVLMQVFKEMEDDSKCPELCKNDEESSDEDSFYDDIPKI